MSKEKWLAWSTEGQGRYGNDSYWGKNNRDPPPLPEF